MNFYSAVRFYAILLFTFSVFFVDAQQIETPQGSGFSCGYNKVNLMNSFGSVRRQSSSEVSTLSGTDVVYQIPVVVHIIYSNACEELSDVRYKQYPSDVLIRFEIQEASQHFRHTHLGARTYTNPYYGVDTKIELKFATIDPNGSYTSGITKIVDPQVEGKSYAQLSVILDKYKWDTQKYCNIFIVKGMTDASGVYIEGGDYTVFDTRAFWSALINHELGHYLGLTHTFVTENDGSCPSNTNCQTSGDGICDTPPKYSAGSLDELCQGDLYNSCTSDEVDLSTNNPYRPVGLGGMGDQPDMTTNYMDYSGRCWDSYTLGQKDKMRSVLETRLQMIAFSETAFSNLVPAYYLNVTNIKLKDGCNGMFTPIIEVENKGTNTVNFVTVKLFNVNTAFSQLEWIGSLLSGQTIEMTFPDVFLTNMLYEFEIIFENPNNQSVLMYQSQICKKYNFINYVPSSELSIPFASCKDSELDDITNDVYLNWSALALTGFTAGSSCRQCVGALLNRYTAPYLIQQASFELLSRDFTVFANPQLSFKMGYIPHQDSGPFDILSVKVSADCGAYETVWEGTGLEIATNDPPAYHNLDGYYYPLCNQYKDMNIDLVRYAGKQDVRIKVEANGKYMGPLMIDDISIEDGVSLDIKSTTKTNFYFTNPVLNELIIHSINKFDTFQIFNVNGEVVLQTGSEQIDVSKLIPGIYFLVAQCADQLVVEKLVKQ